MKLLLENWRQYLNEGESIFDYSVQPDEKVFLAHEPFGEMRTIETGQQKTGYKPRGLWYGCGDEWLAWSRRELPSDYSNSIKHIYRIELDYATIGDHSAYDRVLRISTYEELRSFDDDFGAGGSDFSRLSHDYIDRLIDWKRVSRDYGGIEICPYQMDAHTTHDWYYRWDVASGCIWDKGTIKNIELLGSRQGMTT